MLFVVSGYLLGLFYVFQCKGCIWLSKLDIVLVSSFVLLFLVVFSWGGGVGVCL